MRRGGAVQRQPVASRTGVCMCVCVCACVCMCGCVCECVCACVCVCVCVSEGVQFNDIPLQAGQDLPNMSVLYV
jgi:hypothetical protein